MAAVETLSLEQDTPKLSPPASIVQQATGGNRQAMEAMFRTFLPMEEPIVAVEYLGVMGFFGFGRKSFGVTTASRVGKIELGLFGEVIYQEAMIRDVNSVHIHQPSRLYLYFIIAILVILAIPTYGLSLILIFFAPQLYYRFAKSGVVLGVKEGLFLYAFADRARLPRVRQLLAAMAKQRL